jgi:hypothetical protein
MQRHPSLTRLVERVVAPVGGVVRFLWLLYHLRLQQLEPRD